MMPRECIVNMADHVYSFRECKHDPGDANMIRAIASITGAIAIAIFQKVDVAAYNFDPSCSTASAIWRQLLPVSFRPFATAPIEKAPAVGPTPIQ
jgi:hypothetical protein